MIPGMPGGEGIPPTTSGPLPGQGQPGQMGQSSRPRGASNNQTIPLPAFRLPAKKTQPLNLPLTDDGRLDMEALMAQVEQPRSQSSPLAPPPPVTRYESSPSPSRRQQREQEEALPALGSEYGGGNYPGYGGYSPAGGASSYDPATRLPDGGGWDSVGSGYGIGAEQQWQDEALGQPAGQSEESISAFRRAFAETSALHAVQPIWRPESEEMRAVPQRHAQRQAPGRQGRIGRIERGPLIGGIAVAALLLSLTIWVGLSASGLLAQGKGHPKPVATATATSTPLPTATPTLAATSTSTTNPQPALDRQAAASFRAVSLASYNDGSCGNNMTHFGNGQAIFVNLCASGTASPGPMTVTIRQGGQTLYTLVYSQYVSAGSHYWYSRYGLPSGTYNMVVTLQINGHSATARDIQFTVG